MEDLRKDEKWVIWKTRDDRWTHEMKKEDFHQILSLDKDTRESRWGHKMKEWWRRGDIKVTKYKKRFKVHPECWVKSSVNVPKEAQKDIKTTVLVPQKNYGKDNYTINLTGPDKMYWIGTESGLLGVFHFDGAYTSGDGSCDVASHSMGVGFCNLKSLR
jgi:hypothetical protein